MPFSVGDEVRKRSSEDDAPSRDARGVVRYPAGADGRIGVLWNDGLFRMERGEDLERIDAPEGETADEPGATSRPISEPASGSGSSGEIRLL